MFSRPFFAVLLFGLLSQVAAPPARGQTAADPNEGARLLPNPNTSGAYTFSWWGRAGRSYFIQQSDDLHTWTDLPIIEEGHDQVIRWGFSSTAPKLFLRLDSVDLPTEPPASPGNPTATWGDNGLLLTWTEPAGGDLLTYRLQTSDNNGATWHEVACFSGGRTSYLAVPELFSRTLYRLVAHNGAGGSVPAVFGPVPGRSPLLQAYFDWTAASFSAAELADPNGSGAWVDPDNDGLPNFEEFQAGADPRKPDTDNDNVPDGQDAVPTDADFIFARVSVARYTLVDLGKDFSPVAINNASQAVGTNPSGASLLWAEGQFYPIPSGPPPTPIPPAPVSDLGTTPVGIADDGTVVLNHSFFVEDGQGSRELGSAYRVRFDGAAFDSPQVLNSLYVNEYFPDGDPYVNGATAVSKSGYILGTTAQTVPFQRVQDQQGGPVQNYTRDIFTACRWSPPNYAPERVFNLPDANDTTLTFPSDPNTTFLNAAGWDDRYLGAFGVGDGGEALTRTQENAVATSASALLDPVYGGGHYDYYGLLSTGPGQPSLSLGINSYPRAVNHQLQLAVGTAYNTVAGVVAWIGQQAWKQKLLPINNVGEQLSFNPIKVNDAGQILSDYGTTLWQNGRVYDVNGLIGDPFEPTNPAAGTYTVTELVDLNDAGGMVGVADYQARDAQGNAVGAVERRAVLLKPIRDVDQNPAAGAGASATNPLGLNAAAQGAAAKPPNPTPGVITVRGKIILLELFDAEEEDGDFVRATLDTGENREAGRPPVPLANNRLLINPFAVGFNALNSLPFAGGLIVPLTYGLNTVTLTANTMGRRGPCTVGIRLNKHDALDNRDHVWRVDLNVGQSAQLVLGFSQVHFKTDWPENADHARIARGIINPTTGKTYARLVTIEQNKAAAEGRRRRSTIYGYVKRNFTNLDGTSYGPTVGDQQYDEYPPAAYPENDGVAHVKPTSKRDNEGSGGSIGAQNRQYEVGDVVELVID